MTNTAAADFDEMTVRLTAQSEALRNAEEARKAEASYVAKRNREDGEAMGHLFARKFAHVSHLRKLAQEEFREGEALEVIGRMTFTDIPGEKRPSIADGMARLLGAPNMSAQVLFGANAEIIGTDHLKGFIAAALEDWEAVRSRVDTARQ